MATLARFFLPPSKVQSADGSAKAETSRRRRVPETRSQRSAYGSSGPPTHVRLVRIYLPFSDSLAVDGVASSHNGSSDGPRLGAPFVQLALETGDTSVSLGQLKLDVFAALATSLHVLQAKQPRSSTGMKSGPGSSHLFSSSRVNLGDGAAPALAADNDQNLRGSVVGALPVFSSSSSSGGGGSFGSRHFSMGTSLSRSSSHSSRSWSEARSIGTVSSEDSDLQPQQPSSLPVSPAGGGRRRLGSLGPGEGTVEGGEAYFHSSTSAPAAAAADGVTGSTAPIPEEVLRSAKEASERALAAKAAAARRVPLPPRQRLRSLATTGGAGSVEGDSGGSGGVPQRRRSSVDASSHADETAACQPSPELAEALQRLQRGLPEVFFSASSEVGATGSSSISSGSSSSSGSVTNNGNSTNTSTSSTETEPTVLSPTPWATAASWVEWGSSGAGAALAATMLAKGPSAFVWRAVRHSPTNPSADLSLAEGWLWRRSGSTAAGTAAAAAPAATAESPAASGDSSSSLASPRGGEDADVRSTRMARPSFFRSTSTSSRSGSSSSSNSRPSSKSPTRALGGLVRSISIGSVGSPMSPTTTTTSSSSGEGKWKRRYYALSESPDGSGAVFAVYKDAAKSTLLNAVRLDRVAKVRSLASSDRTAWAHTFKETHAPRGHLYSAQHALLASDGLSLPADQACCFVVEMLPPVPVAAAAAGVSPRPSEEEVGQSASSSAGGSNNSNSSGTGGGIVHLHRCSSADGCAAWVRALEAARLKANNIDDGNDNNTVASSGVKVTGTPPATNSGSSLAATGGDGATAAALAMESPEPSPPVFFENERLPVALVARTAPRAAMPLWHMPSPTISQTPAAATSATSNNSSSGSGSFGRGNSATAAGGNNSSDSDSGSSDSDSDENTPRSGSNLSSGSAREDLSTTTKPPSSRTSAGAASATAVCVVLELAYAHLLPAPTLVANVCGSKKVVDAQLKTYTAYEIEVSQGRLRWTLYRRYSEFVTLHKSVKATAAAQLKALGPITATAASGDGARGAGGAGNLSSSSTARSSSTSSGSANSTTAVSTTAAGIAAAGIIDRYNLPKLPPKTRGRGRFTDQTVDLREHKLGDYLSALLEQPGATDSVHVLSFLGLLSMARANDQTTTSSVTAAADDSIAADRSRSSNEAFANQMSSTGNYLSEEVGSGRNSGRLEQTSLGGSTQPSPSLSSSLVRPVMHVSRLRFHCSPGDLILFRCASSVAAAQRAVTNSEFDHVGMVVPSASSYDSGGLNFLESTAEGCTVYPLQGRLRAYANGFTHYMCLRRLERAEVSSPLAATGGMSSQASSNTNNSCSATLADERPSEYTGPSRLRNPEGWEAELANKLREFSSRVDGKPYGFSVGKLFQRKELENSSSSAAAAAGEAASTNLNQGDQDSKATSRVQEHKDDNDESPSIRQGVTSISEFEDVLLLEDSQEGGSCSSSTSQGTTGTKKKSGSSRVKRLFTLPAKELDLAKKKTFFCSELVAAAQLDAGLLKPTSNASFFWPGSFAVGGEVDGATAAPFQYGPEITIDFKEAEVGKARTF